MHMGMSKVKGPCANLIPILSRVEALATADQLRPQHTTLYSHPPHAMNAWTK